MVSTDKKSQAAAAARTHLDELLDEAIKATFPASDPVAINIERGADEREILTVREKCGGAESRRER